MPPRRRSSGPTGSSGSRAAQPPALVLSGPPERVAGTVSIANTGGTVLTVSDARIEHDSVPSPTTRLVAIVPPGATHTAELEAAYPRDTPPGRYPAQVDLHGQRRAATVVVLDAPACTVTPNRFYLTGPSSEPTPVAFTVTNTGNVPITFARLVTATTTVVLPFGFGYGFKLTLTLDDTIVAAGLTLETGQSREFLGAVTMPANADRTQRFQALVPVGMADLRVVVLPRDPDPPPSEPTAKPTRGRTAPRKRSAASTTDASPTEFIPEEIA